MILLIVLTPVHQNEKKTTRPENGTWPFRNLLDLVLLRITLKQLVTTPNGTILILWHPARLTTGDLVIQELQLALNANVSSESFYFIRKGFQLCDFQFPFETS